MSKNEKAIPNLNYDSMRLFSLTVLQRIDPYIEEILIRSAHVTFYEFNIERAQWSRKDVEGSLFVVKRSAQPRFQFIVMNRRNRDNMVENLLGDFEFEVQGPYILYRNASQEVNGIWFYDKRECEEVASVFNRILNAYSKVNQKPKTSSSKSEFEVLEAVPTMEVMDSPLESSSITRDVPDDPAFLNFFSSAIALENTSRCSESEPPPYQSSPIPIPLQLHQPTITPPPALAAPPQIISPPPLPSLSPLMPLFDNNNPDFFSNNSNLHIDLVKPSSFYEPPRMTPYPHFIPGSPMPTAHQQRSYGTPLLQPFPPPTPPPSLALPPSSLVINRDKVKEALLALVQENEFIDMVVLALQNAHQS